MTYGHRAGSSPRQLLRDAAVTLATVLLAFEHRWLGFISVVALVAAVGAGSTIRPGTGPFQSSI